MIPASERACAITRDSGSLLEAPAPFGLLTAIEWGYGFRGVNANGRPRHSCDPRERLQGVLARAHREPENAPCFAVAGCRCRRGDRVCAAAVFRAGVDLVHFGVIVTDKSGRADRPD